MDAKTLCLAVLSRGDASGYEIRKAFEDGPFHHFFDVGYGSIYPALTKLAEAGLVVGRAETQDKRPAKKVYTITASGRLALLEALGQPPAEDRFRSEFLLVLFFGDLLPAHHLERVLDERIAEIRRRIARMESRDCEGTGGCRAFVHGYGLALYRTALAYFEENRHILLSGALVAESEAPSEAERAALDG